MRKTGLVLFILMSAIFVAPSLAGDVGIGSGQQLPGGMSGGSGMAATKNLLELPPAGTGWDWEKKQIPSQVRKIGEQRTIKMVPKHLEQELNERAKASKMRVPTFQDRLNGLKVGAGRVGIVNLTNTKLNFTKGSSLIPMEQNEIVTFDLDGAGDIKVSIKFGDKDQYTLEDGTFYKIYRNGDNWSFAKLD